MKDCIWQLMLEVFDHHSLQLEFQKVLFDIDLKHIDIQPEASVIIITINVEYAYMIVVKVSYLLHGSL